MAVGLSWAHRLELAGIVGLLVSRGLEDVNGV
jgi:hypothetical protein